MRFQAVQPPCRIRPSSPQAAMRAACGQGFAYRLTGGRLVRGAFVAAAVCALLLLAACGQTGVGASAVSGGAAAFGEAGDAPSGIAALDDASLQERLVGVSLSGGSGKASIESPARLAVSGDGSMTLVVVWSSSHYDKMIVGGVEYAPVNDMGNSTFEIPVPGLDEPLAVQAETTAMSQPHLIDYIIEFDDDASAQAKSAGDTTQSGNARHSGATARRADFHDADLGNGWKPTGSLELEYATCFALDYFEGGFKLLCLSDGQRYLIVPEAARAPSGISEDIVEIRQPIGDIYLVASDTMCLFDALNALDRISVSGISRDNWYIPAAKEAMESGSMAYGGKYSAPDYELLVARGVRLAIESTMINHTPSVREKLIELGIPVFTEMSSYEPEPLGRAEWVKCYGAMLDREQLAAELFEQQVAQVDAIDNAPNGKTVAFFYVNSNGSAVIRRPGDYISRMIERAGGIYQFDGLDAADGAGASVTLEMERFYAEARDADVIVYNASIDADVASVEDLVGKNPLLADFKAVQEGEVWTTEANMYQQMMQAGRIIADFHTVLTGSGADTVFLHKLA